MGGGSGRAGHVPHDSAVRGLGGRGLVAPLPMARRATRRYQTRSAAQGRSTENKKAQGQRVYAENMCMAKCDKTIASLGVVFFDTNIDG